MPRNDPHRLNRLAEDYVVGVMTLGARARFERLIGTQEDVRAAVSACERDLATLDALTPAVAPPPRILTALQRRIATDDAPSSFWQRLSIWRGFAAAGAALSLCLAIGLFWMIQNPTLVERQTAVATPPKYVAVLTDEANAPGFVVTGFNQPFRLTIEPMGDEAARPEASPSQVLRLWAVDRETGAERPLADIATTAAAFEVGLDDAGWELVKAAESLIVSREPVRADGPRSGPVLYSGLCLNLKGLQPL